MRRFFTDEEKESIFQYVLKQIETGRSCAEILETDDEMPPHSTFYSWRKANAEWSDAYDQACEIRNDKIAQEILDIADKQGEDVYIDKNGVERVNHNVIERNKLQVSARQWYLGKLSQKYGNKIDITSGNEKVAPQIVLFKLPDNERD